MKKAEDIFLWVLAIITVFVFITAISGCGDNIHMIDAVQQCTYQQYSSCECDGSKVLYCTSGNKTIYY